MDTTAVPNTKLREARWKLRVESAPPSFPEAAPESADNPEERRRHLERLAELGMRSGNIAHEIKNALVGVKMFVDLLARQNPEAELAPVAAREVARIQRLVSEMLDVAGKPKRETGALSLHAVLEEVIAVLQEPLREKRVRLETVFHRGNDVVHGNFDELKQAFLNVLLNAVDASTKGGVIELRTWIRQRGMLSVAIQDFGPGIRADHLQRLFEPFFTTKTTGTGLGLSITKRIICEHQGTIDVVSMPDEGTTFTLHLPLQRR